MEEDNKVVDDELELDNDEKLKEIEESVSKIQEEDDEDEEKSAGSNLKVELKGKMKFFMLICIGLLVILLVVLGISSLFKETSYSYEGIEEKLIDAAKDYFSDHKNNLPSSESQVVEISDKTLVAEEYLKSLDNYTKEGVSCSGKVVVQKSSSAYSYVAYLDCGKEYKTESLFDAVTKKTVTSGDGLYNTKLGYIYRGELVNNYVKLGHYLFRIVKIDNDGIFHLVISTSFTNGSVWDDRFNTKFSDNVGINDFKVSRIRDLLSEGFDYIDDEDEEALLTKKDRTRLASVDLCIGGRSDNATAIDGSLECSEKIPNQKIGLLTVSDYMLASIDKNCTTTVSEACQNYNYLANGHSWWTMTRTNDTTDKAYLVLGDVVESRELTFNADVRPVIYLKSNVVKKSGKGTFEKPYKLK